MSVQIWNFGQTFVLGTKKIFLAKRLEMWGEFRMDFLSVE
jgi:hypothetical protein